MKTNVTPAVIHAMSMHFVLIVMERFHVNASAVILVMDSNVKILTNALFQCITVTRMPPVLIPTVTSNVTVTLDLKVMVSSALMLMSVPMKIMVAQNSHLAPIILDRSCVNVNLGSLVMDSTVMTSMNVMILLVMLMHPALIHLVVIHVHVIPVSLVMASVVLISMSASMVVILVMKQHQLVVILSEYSNASVTVASKKLTGSVLMSMNVYQILAPKMDHVIT